MAGLTLGVAADGCRDGRRRDDWSADDESAAQGAASICAQVEEAAGERGFECLIIAVT